MPLVVKDRVRETSTTAGSGTFTLAGAVTGYQSFSAIGNGNTTYYTIYLQGGNEWEVGIGTYTASGTTLSRDTVLASSAGGAKVNFSAGVKDVFVTYPADRSVWYDTATNVTLNALTLSGGTANGVLYLNGSKVATSGSALTFTGTVLGVGIASPVVANGNGIHVANSAGASRIHFTDSTTGETVNDGVELASSGGDFYIEQKENKVISVYTNGFERLRLLGGTNTNLNIGGNFTSTNNTLQVTGNAAIGYTAAAPANGLIVSGDVGIGTDAPLYKAHAINNADAFRIVGMFENPNTGTSAQAAVRVKAGTNTATMGLGGSGVSGAAVYIGADQATPILYYTGNSYHYWQTATTEKMRLEQSGTLILRQSSNAANTSVSFNTTVQNALTLDSSGNLGVGLSPVERLTVNSPNSNPATIASFRNSTKSSNFTINVAAGANQYLQGAVDADVLLRTEAGNLGIGVNDNTKNIFFGSSTTTRAILDSSGNLGLGVTPSAWSGVAPVFQSGYGSYFLGNTGGQTLHIGINHYYNGSTWIYTNSVAASRYDQTAGSHRWFRSTSTPTAGTDPVFSQAMTLDASGRLGIGTTSPGSFDAVADDLVVGNGIGNIGITIYSADTGRGSILFADGTAAGGADSYRGFIEYDHSGNNFLRFGTNAVERVRIASDGTVFMRDGTSTTNTNSSKLVVNGTISETVGGVQYLVASQADIGTAPNEIPLNQYLGNLAYQDAGSIAGQVGLSAGTVALPSLVSATDTDTGMWFPAANTLAWSTGGARAMTLDASGRLLINATTSRGDNSPLQVTNDSANSIEVFRGETSQFGPTVLFNKSRGSTGSPTVVGSGDAVGLIAFKGYDGSSYKDAALIQGVVDGTPGANDMPGRIVFSTTADGAASATERARITSTGGFETRPAANGHAVFNEDSVDADFRVESDGNTHTLFVDASNDRIGQSISTPTGRVHTVTFDVNRGVYIEPTTDVASTYGNAGTVNNLMTLRAPYNTNPEGAGNSGMLWGLRFTGTVDADITANTKSAGVYARSEDVSAGYNRTVGLEFQTAAQDQNKATATRITGFKTLIHYGASTFNEDGGDFDFRVEGDADTNLIFADASTDRVGIGTNSPGGKFSVAVANNATYQLAANITNQVNADFNVKIATSITLIGPSTSTPFCLGVADAEKARITSGGYFKAQGASTYINSAGSYHEFVANADNNEVLAIQSKASNGTQYGASITTNNDQNDATRWFLKCTGAATDRAIIRSNGGLANYSANDVNLASDRRLKNTIEPMRSYYDVFKNLNWVTWLYNDQTDDLKNHGVIAQELQALAPEFVCESNAKEAQEGEAPYLGIWEQDFKMAGMSVITELIKKIEKLEAEVAALKGA